MVPTRVTWRQLRFDLLERVVLPITVPLFRLLVWSWRIREPPTSLLSQLAEEPRLVIATYHGMLVHLVAFHRLAPERGRRFVVMLSPSRDGRLLAAFLRYFGVDHVQAATGSRGTAGALEFVRRIEAGDVGIVGVDGPRGPCAIAKPGTVRMALSARAAMVLAVTHASYGITLGSWDRAHLPGPFARIELSLETCATDRGASDDENAAAVQDGLRCAARAIGNPLGSA